MSQLIFLVYCDFQKVSIMLRGHSKMNKAKRSLLATANWLNNKKKVQWCPDLVHPDLVDCRDLVD